MSTIKKCDMGILDFFKKKSNFLAKIGTIAENGVIKFQSDYRPLTQGGKCEVYIMCFQLSWRLYFENTQQPVPNAPNINVIKMINEYLTRHGVRLDESQLLRLYHERFANFFKEVVAISVADEMSDELKAKTLPAYSYSVINIKPLDTNVDVLWADYDGDWDIGRVKDLTHNFLEAYIDLNIWVGEQVQNI